MVSAPGWVPLLLPHPPAMVASATSEKIASSARPRECFLNSLLFSSAITTPSTFACDLLCKPGGVRKNRRRYFHRELFVFAPAGFAAATVAAAAVPATVAAASVSTATSGAGRGLGVAQALVAAGAGLASAGGKGVRPRAGLRRRRRGITARRLRARPRRAGRGTRAGLVGNWLNGRPAGTIAGSSGTRRLIRHGLNRRTSGAVRRPIASGGARPIRRAPTIRWTAPCRRTVWRPSAGRAIVGRPAVRRIAWAVSRIPTAASAPVRIPAVHVALVDHGVAVPVRVPTGPPPSTQA